MAFADPISITYNTVAKNLVRTRPLDGYGHQYELDEGTEKYSLTIRHTVPQRGAAGESHLVRLDVEHYDADGVLERTSSAWTVIKTFDGVQVAADSDYTAQALVDFLSDSNIDKIVARES